MQGHVNKTREFTNQSTQKHSRAIQVLATGLLVVLVIAGLRLSHPLPKVSNAACDVEEFDLAAYRNSDEFKRKHPQVTRSPVVVPAHLTEETEQADEDSHEKSVVTEPAFEPQLLDGDPGKVKEVISILRTIKDPELDINIYDLGLIRQVKVASGGDVKIELIFTSVFCPFSGQMIKSIKQELAILSWCDNVAIKVNLKQKWSRSFLTPQGRQHFKKLLGW